ncbi:MAG: L-seryl-tRNA(Sec) selenium transferase [Polyangiaceae bacterium]|nr:L-seryl-tRNA(Sec) selenium transferase [Polyangiaceae bacterium]
MAGSTVKRLPRVDRVTARPELDDARKRLGPRLVVGLVRAAIEERRQAILADPTIEVPAEESVAADVRARVERLLGSRARRVINATGVVLHTNLGRAPLGPEAARAVHESALGYSSIELDLRTGKRGGRGRFLEAALVSLTGAEAAVAVNNCAAGVLLLLAALARGRDVIVSRGELVEIGGGFRVPEIMSESGARLVEVGTTNKTRASDYARALDASPDAAAILRIHQSNFVQLGFVERPSVQDLAQLARDRSVLLLEDIGGGALIDLKPAGLAGEPTVASSIAAGADAVAFSGDKVLGGPQAGIVVGKSAVIERMRRHPLARAIRLGRLPMAALEATLEPYLEGRAVEALPILGLVHEPVERVRSRADAWAAELGKRGVAATVVATEAEMGGGAVPGRTLGSAAVRIEPRGERADELAARLRTGAVPVLGRVQDDALLLDARTVLAGEDDALLDAVAAAVGAP